MSHYCLKNCFGCETCDSKGDITTPNVPLVCPNDPKVPIKENKRLSDSLLSNEPFYNSVGVPKTMDQIHAQLDKRNNDHFKREIYPTLGRDDQRHFDKKFEKMKKDGLS